MRPIEWAPLTEADPAPGDAGRLGAGAKHYAKVTGAIDLAAQRLTRITTGLDAESKAVDALRSAAGEVAGDVTRARERYAGVAQALTDYAPVFARAQEDTLVLRRKAQTAADEERDARRRAAEAAARAAAAPPAAAEFDRTEQARQESLADAARQVITDAQKSLAEIAITLAEARRKALGRIRDVHGSGGLKDGWRDNFGGLVNRYVAPILPALNAISALLGGAALLLGWVPFLGPALGAAALIVAGFAFLANLAMSVGGEAGWRETIIAGVGLASFGLAKIASARYVTAAGGARGSSRRLAGQLASRTPAHRRGLQLPDDANSARAIDRMMGQVNPLSRNQARDLLDKAANNGVAPAAGRFVRELPGQVGKDLNEARHFRPHHLDDLPPNPGRAFGLMGERGMGPAAANLDSVHPAIQESAQVSEHLASMKRSGRAVGLGAGAGAGAWSYETWTLGNNPSGAERLNLSEGSPLEPAVQ